MAVDNIIVKPYEVPIGVDKSEVITTALKFNTDTIESFCTKYIGTSKVGRKKLLKKIASGVDDVVYTISFLFEKAPSGYAVISYSLSIDDYNIISLEDQLYFTISEFTLDIDYINDTIKSVFK
jgi:hypothetical protein